MEVAHNFRFSAIDVNTLLYRFSVSHTFFLAKGSRREGRLQERSLESLALDPR
jgi:hypothetical protein